jgi:hypothetical protein
MSSRNNEIACRQKIADRDGCEDGSGKRRHPGTDREMADPVALRNNNRMGFFAFSENRCVTQGKPPQS